MTEQFKNHWLFAPLEELPAFQAMTAALSQKGVVAAYGLDDSQRIHLVAAAAEACGRQMIVACSNEMLGQRMVEDLNTMLGTCAMLLPSREITFLKAAASSKELAMRRIEALGLFLSRQVRILVVPADALMHRLMPRKKFQENIITVHEGQQMEPNDLIARLVSAGYERVDLVEGRGQCALRGGILDVFPVGQPNALRLEFFDDEIDSLRNFDSLTQRSISKRESAILFPASEVLLTHEEAQRAADRLETLVSGHRDAAPEEDRQRKIEKEYDLIPFEEFFQMASPQAEDNPDALPGMWDIGVKNTPAPKSAPAKKPINPRTTLHRNFFANIDALRTGRAVEGRDALINVLLDETESVLEYAEDPVIVLDQPERLRERCENRTLEFEENWKAAMERDEAIPEQAELICRYDVVVADICRHTAITLNPFLRTSEDFPPRALFKFEGVGATAYQANVRELARDIDKWEKEGYRIALLAGGVARGQRLKKALDEQSLAVPFTEVIPDAISPGKPVILPIGIHRGFLYPELRFAVVSEGDIFGVGKQKRTAHAAKGEKMAAFTELAIGDYVVHENHGIGQYMGTVRLASEGTYRDFLHIRYQGTDKLYVPTDQLDRVQKYIGSEGEAPKLNRLSGGEWQKQKAKVKSSIKEMAGDLVKLYAERKAVAGYAFAPDTPWQREFEDAFPYEETPDQLTAVEDIKRDMERPQVMDRLLCGDVGYGKTEVALRAIFKAVMDGKQAALLAPTTILVQQHYATMLNRFGGFPIRVETISRFRTAAEQKKIIQQLKAGEVDVIVGTHRLLNKDVEFKDLGLLVVDEEQRFGVAHKESIKQLKKNVDVLTLSATPIPRTLHMSMVGIRDMSLLQSPPEERYPVQTYVVEYSDGLVRDAILREISRGGQVYVLHNRVQTIEMMYTRLKKLVPEARIAIGHGQMREHQLEDIMIDFYEGKFDVLLCTTIIEAGLDVPRANTMIICDADRFGLAQLYQLRGRVGRSNKLAYAYLTVNPNKIITADADKRLAAIREFTEFGSGFRVAMRDLEIRGTGNLLGSEQSGHMASVGYDLYVKMIEETVHELRGDISQGDIETRVELHVDAYLPSEYVASDLMRVEMYKKIAGIDSRDAREDLIEELIDRFGDPTRPVMNLINIAHLKSLCSKLGIDLVSERNQQLMMRFSMAADLDVMRLLHAIHPHEKCLKLAAGNPPSLAYFAKGKPTEELLSGAVTVMEKIVAEMFVPLPETTE